MMNPTEMFNAFGHKWGFPSWMLLNLCVIFFFVYKMDTSKTQKSVFISTALILLLFFPPIINYMCKVFVNSGHEYARIGWGMLSLWVISYGLAYMIIKGRFDREKKLAVFLIAFCVGCILLAGNNVRTYFAIPSNMYTF